MNSRGFSLLLLLPADPKPRKHVIVAFENLNRCEYTEVLGYCKSFKTGQLCQQLLFSYAQASAYARNTVIFIHVVR